MGYDYDALMGRMFDCVTGRGQKAFRCSDFMHMKKFCLLCDRFKPKMYKNYLGCGADVLETRCSGCECDVSMDIVMRETDCATFLPMKVGKQMDARLRTLESLGMEVWKGNPQYVPEEDKYSAVMLMCETHYMKEGEKVFGSAYWIVLNVLFSGIAIDIGKKRGYVSDIRNGLATLSDIVCKDVAEYHALAELLISLGWSPMTETVNEVRKRD